MISRSVTWAGTRLVGMFTGWGRGYRRLAESHAGSVAGDALFAVALAGTLFFTVPTTEARQNVALYLVVTLAPFALLGPLLGRVFERSPGAYRGGMVVSALGRVVVAVLMVFAVDSFWLFPLAFTMLVLSRFHGISRSSVLPVLVGDPGRLVEANARLARIGVLAAAVVVLPAALLVFWLGAWPALVLAVGAYAISAISAFQLPPVPRVGRGNNEGERAGRRRELPRRVRLARFATAGVRFLNGYLVLLVAFAFREADAGVASLSALIVAAGLGYYLAAWAAPAVGSWVREEPMVVGALAIEAGAAFIGAQVFSLVAASVLVAAAGFAWGTAKFGFDGLLQANVAAPHRGRAFTMSETMFQVAWVMGALIPVLPFWPTELGLASAGVLALVIQVGYVSLVLVPETMRWKAVASSEHADEKQDGDLLDLL